MMDDDLPRREPPAPEDGELSASGTGPRVRRRGPGSGAMGKGTTAALAMFAVAAAAEVGTLVWAWLSGAGSDEAGKAFLGVAGMLVAVFVFAAPAVALALPKPERRSFWATGVICAFLGFILWGVTCGLAVGIPGLGA